MDKITARMTKDLNGYSDYFAGELDKLIGKRCSELAPLYNRLQKSAVAELNRINKELEKLPEAKRKSKRVLQQLQQQYVDGILPDLELAKAAQDPFVTSTLCGTFEYGYYTQAYSLEQAAKVAVNVPILNRSGVLGIIANDWVGDGNTYSDRIRRNTDWVATQATKTVKRLVTKRQSYDEAADSLSKAIGESKYNAMRIVRTEMTRANGLGTSYAAMENADILDGKYRDAVRDSRTSGMCAADADISYSDPYPVDYDTPANPGIPGHRIPNHPNCRCRWRMVVSAVGVNKRAQIARKNDSKDSYGENYYTEATTFDGYAKERGLPSVAEMLEHDNPKRYLRPGETVDSIKQQVKRVKFDGKTVTVPKALWDKGTTNTVKAVDNAVESVIIKADEVAIALGDTHTAAMTERLENAPENVQKVWNKYAKRYHVVDAEYNGTAHYEYATRGIKISVTNNTKDLTFDFGTGVGKQVYKKAYGTVFHELGHHTSSLYALDNGLMAWDDVADFVKSKKYPGKTLTAMLKDEGTEYIAKIEKELKAAFKLNATNMEWLHDNGFLSTWDYDFYKKNGFMAGPMPKYSKSVAYNKLRDELREIPVIAGGDISDMWDGITNGRAMGFMGHTSADKQYWKWHSVGSEAFAEMFDATINNPASLEQIKHYFPKSYEIFNEILDEIGGV